VQESLKEVLKKEATQFGFSDLRFISAKPLLESEKLFHEWRDKGYAAEMSYMTRVEPINARPEFLLKSAKTLLVFTANYYSPVPERPSFYDRTPTPPRREEPRYYPQIRPSIPQQRQEQRRFPQRPSK
jgi:epoxyqueuosine reductase QueG